jgi:2-phospho-L-lactate guanylyltransferase
MAAIVVPFRGAAGKTRLGASAATRRALSLAMLGDVLAAAVAVGETFVVTADADGGAVAAEVGARVVDDPGGGHGAAVAAALAGLEPGPLLVVNADLPCAVPRDLRALLRATSAGGIALVAASDGTTNALGLPAPEVFSPLYGPGSAERFAAHARVLGLEPLTVAIPNLADDVDTPADLARVELRAGPRTQAALARAAA